MDYASGYHELANIIKGVPIQCMVSLITLIFSLGQGQTLNWLLKRRYKNQWQQTWSFRCQ